MTVYNTFCYSLQYNDDNSFQQKRYRVFNKEVGKERYESIFKEVESILGKPNVSLTEFWKSVTMEQWQQLLSIPEAKDFKEGFEYISGCQIEDVKPSLKGKVVSVIIDGETYSATIN